MSFGFFFPKRTMQSTIFKLCTLRENWTLYTLTGYIFYLKTTTHFFLEKTEKNSIQTEFYVFHVAALKNVSPSVKSLSFPLSTDTTYALFAIIVLFGKPVPRHEYRALSLGAREISGEK